MLLGQKQRSIVLTPWILVVWLSATAVACRAQEDTWATQAPMPTARLGLCSAVVDGRIYAIGGYPAANEPGLRTVEAYDPVTDTWTTKAPMPTGRRWLSCSAVDGSIYALGGHQNFGEPSLNIVEAYDAASNDWSTRAPMPTARKGFCTAMVEGKLYAIGGVDEDEEILATVERYDPVTDSWSSKADMPTARALFSCAVVGGVIYAVGGPWPGSAGISTVEAYDPATDTWTTKADMPTGRVALSTSVVAEKIYAIGGASGFTGQAVVEEYDPATDTWTPRSSMPYAVGGVEEGIRFGLATRTVDGRIFAIGGALDPVPPHPGLALVQAYTAPVVATDIDAPPDGQIDYGAAARPYNYPNPFTSSTAIRFELSEAQPVRLAVYDVLGRTVRVLADGVRGAGTHDVEFRADGLPGGVYLYRLETHGRSSTGTMGLVR